MEQGRSGRPVLVLRTPFPEGLESPAEPEKPIFNMRAYRVHKILVRVSVFNNCAGATAAVWIQCANTFSRRATYTCCFLFRMNQNNRICQQTSTFHLLYNRTRRYAPQRMPLKCPTL